ncbi:hypothetical protein GCM10010124_28440 [Pilimelia terevasa]|uniref:DUF4360 domain-containing protein n=1 Tax=Pilimelia terevasa TaxID=53372 RepID=A0A8J3BRR7_9ACTN|nr:hypothetical protein [Pilimelia terevasa]GGK34152.1 hypothetical protein GCM10010124_28440 [Pilimelia terevasa]
MTASALRQVAACAVAALAPLPFTAPPAAAAASRADWVSVTLTAVAGLCTQTGTPAVEVVGTDVIRLSTPGFTLSTTGGGLSTYCEATIEVRMKAHKRLELAELRPRAEIHTSVNAGAQTAARVEPAVDAGVESRRTWPGNTHVSWGPPVEGAGTELVDCGARQTFKLITELHSLTQAPTDTATLHSGTTEALRPAVAVDAYDC